VLRTGSKTASIFFCFVFPMFLGAVPAGAVADKRDVASMHEALNRLLQSAGPNSTIKWSNPQTGNSGTITAIETRFGAEGPCWRYRRSYGAPGPVFTVDGTACENVPGLWEIVEENPARPLRRHLPCKRGRIALSHRPPRARR